MGVRTTLPRINSRAAGPTVVITIESAIADPPDGAVRLRDLIIKSTADALANHGSYLWAYGGGFTVVENDAIDIRTTLSFQDKRRFYVVRGADKKTAGEIAAEMGKAESSGAGTFSYSDMLGYVLHRHPRMKALVPVLRAELALIELFLKSADLALLRKHQKIFGTFFIENDADLGLMDSAAPVIRPAIVDMAVCSPYVKVVMEKRPACRAPPHKARGEARSPDDRRSPDRQVPSGRRYRACPPVRLVPSTPYTIC